MYRYNDEGSDNSPRGGRYRCERRCDDRYQNSSYRRDRSRYRESKERAYDTGMSRFNFTLLDSGVFMNEKLLGNSDDLGQIIIVDSGCPRSLMGDHQLEELKNLIDVKIFSVKEEGFRFGPSKVYRTNTKAKITMQIGINVMKCEFFVIKGNIPILLGNDIMEPNGGNIDMEDRILFLSKVDMEIPLKKTNGGHFVIPVRSIADIDKNNVKGEEADLVMLMVLENVDDEDVIKLHDEVGHSAFLALLALTDEEESQVKKVHRYFGHRSARKIWELYSKAKQLKGKKQAVLNVLNKCKICSPHKKAPPRPRVGLPVANTFNDVVGLDLKVVNKNKGEYILWMVDLFSKLIKGKFIKDKNPETIINGILSTWVIGDGAGPGFPSRGFWSDNGGEFLNHEVMDFAASMDVDIKMTSAEAPWQNGCVERHHATADNIFEKLMEENTKMPPQDAVNHAAFAKNCDTNRTGFSPLQLMTGKNPTFPGLAEVTPASNNVDSSTKYMKTLKSMDDARVKMREIDCNEKLKKVRSEKVNPNVEKTYNLGDPVFFYDDKRKQWKKATALIRLGKTLYLRFGNFLRRVAIDKVRPDPNGEICREESYIDGGDDNETDENNERFVKEETPVADLAADIGISNQNKILENKVEKLEKEIENLRKSKDNAENEEEENLKSSFVEEDIGKDIEKEKVVQKRIEKKMKQKAKKEAEKLKAPTTGQNILFKETDEEGWKAARVVSSWKKNSKYRYWKHLLMDGDVIVEKDFENGIKDWKIKTEDSREITDEVFLLDSSTDNVFPVRHVPAKDYDMPEVKAAVERELLKYKSFDAFKEVNDNGQKSIPTRWVVTEQADSGKDELFKARLCMRGDLEYGKESIRSDAPTASKEAIKLTLAIAANEGFTVKSGDIKSAYLQGEAMNRDIYVRPPKEANVHGKLWLLLQGAYGIVDGGRLFYLKLSEKLLSLGMHRIHSDGAMFSYVKDGKLHGIVTTHSDDLILAGDDAF